MRSLIKDKWGITPVLSNILLMVVAVAAMSLAASATYVITNNLRQVMGERVIVEDVWFTTGKISMYLRNIGKVSSTVKLTYVNSSSQVIDATTFEVEEHGWLNIVYNWTPNSVYEINIVTSKGSRIMDYYTSP